MPRSSLLFTAQSRHEDLVARLGLPQVVDADSNGLGPMDVWQLRLGCGIELSLLVFRWKSTGEPWGVDEAAGLEVHSSSDDVAHVCFHLGLDPAAIGLALPLAGLGAPLPYRVLRQDDHGTRFEMRRVSSRCEAAAVVEEYTRKLHHQIYWWETIEAE